MRLLTGSRLVPGDVYALQTPLRYKARVRRIAVLLACSLAALAASAPAFAGGPKMLLGAAEDAVRKPTLPAATARLLPSARHFVVGNEPNLNRYWLPQFGPDGEDVAAVGYESLLAKTYDALKAVSPKLVVLGGAVSPRGGDRPGTGRDTHSPTAFITDMGAA